MRNMVTGRPSAHRARGQSPETKQESLRRAAPGQPQALSRCEHPGLLARGLRAVTGMMWSLRRRHGFWFRTLTLAWLADVAGRRNGREWWPAFRRYHPWSRITPYKTSVLKHQ